MSLALKLTHAAYTLGLIAQVITVSVETVTIIRSVPSLGLPE
jgi:hypothetical protein